MYSTCGVSVRQWSHYITYLFPSFRPLDTNRSILKARGQRTADTISVEKMFMGPTTRRERCRGGGSGIKCRSEIFLWVNALHVGKGIPTLARIRRTDLKANTMNIPLRKRGRQTMAYSGDSNSVGGPRAGFAPNPSSIQRRSYREL